MKDELFSAVNLKTQSSVCPNLNWLSFSLYRAEILGVTGLNGSGISTLTSALCGQVPLADGSLYLDRRPIATPTIDGLQRCGVCFVSCESSLIPMLNVTENICVIRAMNRDGFLIHKSADQDKVRRLFAEYDIRIDPAANVYKLSPFEQKAVELCRALMGRARILILDRIDEGLNEENLGRMHALLKRIRQSGVSILVLQPNVQRVLAIADRILVVRHGYVYAEMSAAEATADRVLQLILPGDLEQKAQTAAAHGRLYARFERLSIAGLLRDADMELYSGIATGVVADWNSASMLPEALFGDRAAGGNVVFRERTLSVGRWAEENRNRICYLNKFWTEKNLFLNLTIGENLMLRSYKRFQNRFGVLNRRMLRFALEEYCLRLDMDYGVSRSRRPNSIPSGARSDLILTGLEVSPPDLLIMEEPFFSADELRRNQVLDCMDRLKRGGTAILCIASNQTELSQYCERLYELKDKSLKIAWPGSGTAI